MNLDSEIAGTQQLKWGGIRWALALYWVVCALLTGCSTAQKKATPEAHRRFDFPADTFAYSNELVWAYGYDADGKWRGHRRDPGPDYWQHCFVVARTAAQFFRNARFDSNQPPADEKAYRRLIRKVARSSLKPKTEEEPIVIPGYPDLRSFSKAQEKVLKDECGGAMQSYFQRGNWRMIFPFSRHQQAATVDRLQEQLSTNGVAVVHLVTFPHITINHAVLLFDAKRQDKNVLFTAYDPNDPSNPKVLSYDRRSRTFIFPANDYFPGGRVDVYQIYHRWNY